MSEYHLSPAEANAVARILADSALATCAGVPGRVELTDNVLTIEPSGWSWSSGELVLLAVLTSIAGYNTLPDLHVLDADNQAVVRGALAGLVNA